MPYHFHTMAHIEPTQSSATLSNILHNASYIVAKADKDFQTLIMTSTFHDVLCEICDLPLESSQFRILIRKLLTLLNNKYVILDRDDVYQVYRIVLAMHKDITCIEDDPYIVIRFWNLVSKLKRIGFRFS